jgi:hypothetical protein
VDPLRSSGGRSTRRLRNRQQAALVYNEMKAIIAVVPELDQRIIVRDVNPRMAENLSTVLACVNAIASSCRACRRMRKLESEFSRSVFSAATRSTHRLELDLSGPAAR